MKLVWHAEGLWEADWLREVLGDLIDEEIVDLDLQCFEDNSIHIISSNWRPLASYDRYAGACRARCSRIVLLHLSDEFFSGGYAVYRNFDAVIRNFRTVLADSPGILTIPEGYSNGTPLKGPLRAAHLRSYAWSFSGEIKASRIEMAAALEGFHPSVLNRTASISNMEGKKLSKPEYFSLLANSAFSPCPMGNVILETWRLYESLELGCIPLVERRKTLDYFETLFGPNPIPAFNSWQAARSFAEDLFANKCALDAKQAEIGVWWVAYKAHIEAKLKSFTASSHAPELMKFGDLPHNRFRALYEPARVTELLRHQTIGSLARRLGRPTAPIKRLLSERLAPHIRKSDP